MIPLLLLSIFFVMLVVVYLMTIRRGAVVSSGYMATADALLRKRDYLGLLAVSNRHGEAIARVVQKVLDFMTKNPQADLQQVREIAETEGTRVAASLNNRVIYLADIGMIAPLLGLLGTVFGIIHSFGALGADIGSARYVALSRGISEALVNTAAGLAIGIPAMIFYAFFRGRAQKLISELEAASHPCVGFAFVAVWQAPANSCADRGRTVKLFHSHESAWSRASTSSRHSTGAAGRCAIALVDFLSAHMERGADRE